MACISFIIFPAENKFIQIMRQTVFISGGSRGIGRACAIALATKGARIGIHYHKNEQAAQDTLSSLPGEGHLLFQADLRQENKVEQMIKRVFSEWETIDVLVNSAGIYTEHPIESVDASEWMAQWRNILSVNVLGMAHLCYHFGRKMMQQHSGRIINIGSRGAFRGEAESPAYGASKAAVHALSQSLAKKLGEYGTSVTAVAPGFVETDMGATVLETERGEALRGESPFGRVAQPEEVAHLVAFLADPDSGFLSGGIVDINGASYLRM
jgi:NAD(P)-dependent dehydrogenase (short-subunit alcohol dehydrogenase family)